MQEALRQYYLQQLGIVAYRARRQLPGAAASPVLTIEKLKIDNSPAAGMDDNARIQLGDEGIAPAIGGERSENALKNLADLKSATKTNSKVVDKPANTRKLTDSVADAAEQNSNNRTGQATLHFHFEIQRLGAEILIVDSAQPSLALPTKKLLHNIVVALGRRVEDLSATETLRWPMPRDVGLNHSEAEGRAMLQAYFEAQYNKRPWRFLLLMGSRALYYALPLEVAAGQDLSQLYGRELNLENLVAGSSDLQTISVPSLVEMLQNPSLKKLTWRAIQPLRLPSHKID